MRSHSRGLRRSADQLSVQNGSSPGETRSHGVSPCLLLGVVQLRVEAAAKGVSSCDWTSVAQSLGPGFA